MLVRLCHQISPIKPAIKIQFINELKDLVFDCDVESILSGACITPSGAVLLQALDFTDRNIVKFLGICIASTVGWRILAWAVLEARIRTRR